MEVTCPACAARYTADEQKLRGKTARMRCRACDTVWMVAGPEDTAGGEAKRVKRGAEREHRDLFAAREPDLGSVPSTMRPPPPTDGVGARNESSVLFTVASLKGAARVKTPEPSEAPPPPSMRMEDDEGVIDLNALATVPPKAGARPVAAPLFSEPPPAAFARDASSHSGELGMNAGAGPLKLGKRAIIGIAAAAAAVVLMGIGVAAAFKGEEPVARATATMAPLPAAPAPAAPAVDPKPAEPAPAPTTAQASSSSADDDDDAKSSTPARKKGKGRKGGGKRSSGGGKSPNMSKVASSGVAPVKTKPAADKCHCKGDFNCILRCTATGK